MITGATSGLGLAFSKLYCQTGYDLILISRNLEKLENLKKELPNSRSNIHIFACDLSDPIARDQLGTLLIQQSYIPDILINNAGIGGFGKFDERPFSDEQSILELNMTTPTYFCNLLSPELKKKQTQTYILNIVSAAAFVPGPYQATYYASKSYLLSYSLAIGYELRKSNIFVSAFCPGVLTSNFHKNAGYSTHKKGLDCNIAALSAHRALINKKRLFITPARTHFMIHWLVKFLPRSLVCQYVARRSMKMIETS